MTPGSSKVISDRWRRRISGRIWLQLVKEYGGPGPARDTACCHVQEAAAESDPLIETQRRECTVGQEQEYCRCENHRQIVTWRELDPVDNLAEIHRADCSVRKMDSQQLD